MPALLAVRLLGSVTGRSWRSVGLSRFPLTGHCRRGSNFVIFPASKLGTSHSSVTISFRRCPSAAQREPTFEASQEFPSSSPDRSLPPLVQFGHSSVPETRERSFNRGRRFSWLRSEEH